ncbi:S8 family serine peptidase [Spirilliplanes yamanashiensis]|uniref:Serine protease n=1 Tax=Spirilliplanes yamanashiensis TaxID=42233 RepID=A0A8J3Y304_9ACTN|nr:S8 family serine peptidase [Spirilliplanes yamanashiensis]MDP9814353.1 subtilisin family serine protease [Spirilliplanes yamanashiensis]GIJ00665.1 serine protease [Spirilliplanes yamanashiensis]
MTRSRRTFGILIGSLVALGAAVGTAGTALAGTTQATGRILQEGAAGAITNSYIVVLKTTAGTRVAGEASGLARTYGGTVRRNYTSAVKGFTITTTPAAARRLAANSAVAYVEQDRVVTLDAVQTAPTWGLDRVDQQALPLSRSYSYGSAAGVTAYVLDSGLRVSHAEFGGRARAGWDFIDNDADVTDCNGHGTHVGGTVGGATYGVAKDVKLVGVRVLDCAGSGAYSKIIAGVDWVTANAVKPAVANMSLGGSNSTALDDAVKRSIASGVTYAVAAGNDNVDACQQSPARLPGAITVGATDSADARASFSNYGACLDIFAPGVKITAASKASDTGTAIMSGTSMAAPHVAGAAALVLGANPSWTPVQVRDDLVGSAGTGRVTNPGAGSVNKLLYTGAITAAPQPATTPTTPPTTMPTTTPTTTPTTPPTTAPSTPAVTACGPFTAKKMVMIGDRKTITSAQTVAGCTGTASAAAKVSVAISHSARGNLAIWLVGPGGVTYKLKSASSTDTADNVKATYTVDASGSPRNGTWTLKITDQYSGNIGFLTSWSLTL